MMSEQQYREELEFLCMTTNAVTAPYFIASVTDEGKIKYTVNEEVGLGDLSDDVSPDMREMNKINARGLFTASFTNVVRIIVESQSPLLRLVEQLHEMPIGNVTCPHCGHES